MYIVYCILIIYIMEIYLKQFNNNTKEFKMLIGLFFFLLKKKPLLFCQTVSRNKI